MARRRPSRDYVDCGITNEETGLLMSAIEDADVRLGIISAFGKVIEVLVPYNLAGVLHESNLPYRKIVIEPCLIKEISTNSDAKIVNELSTAAIQLAAFQAGFNEADVPVPPFSLTENQAPLKFWHLRRRKAIKEFAAEVSRNGDLIRALSDKRSAEARRIHERVQEARRANPNFERQQAQDKQRAQHSLTAVPLTGSVPDIFSAEPVWMDAYSKELVLVAFRDIKPLAASQGARATIEYPFVMAVIDMKIMKPVYLLTAELGVMSNTSCLCAFDGGGMHLNFGSWDMNSNEMEFIDKAKSMIFAMLDRISHDGE